MILIVPGNLLKCNKELYVAQEETEKGRAELVGVPDCSVPLSSPVVVATEEDRSAALVEPVIVEGEVEYVKASINEVSNVSGDLEYVTTPPAAIE
jgi:hypothetical protein